MSPRQKFANIQVGQKVVGENGDMLEVVYKIDDSRRMVKVKRVGEESYGMIDITGLDRISLEHELE